MNKKFIESLELKNVCDVMDKKQMEENLQLQMQKCCA